MSSLTGLGLTPGGVCASLGSRREPVALRRRMMTPLRKRWYLGLTAVLGLGCLALNVVAYNQAYTRT